MRRSVLLLCSFLLLVSCVSYAAAPAGHAAPGTLAVVKARHALQCGIVKEEEDYNRDDDHGNRAALDLDLCRAVGVAVLGAHAKITVVTFPDEGTAIKGLLAKKADILASASPSLPNKSLGVGFSQPALYDGQAFLVLKRLNVHSPDDLAEHKVCFLAGTSSDSGLRAYAARRKISYIWYPFSELGEMEAAFVTGNCDAMTADATQLANTRAIFHRRAAEYEILPTLIRPDPLATAYRAGDAQWASVVDWTIALLIQAEESGVTQAKVDAMKTSEDPVVRALLGQPHGTGDALHLPTDWGAAVLRETGNYGEIFERDLGASTPLKLERGMNRSWSTGGLMMAPPFVLR